jgi:hypothetical protein
MRRNEMVEALRASPFQPFRVHVSDGTTFDIRHPEMLMVTRQSAVVGILESRDTGESGDVYPQIERSTTVDLLHVTQIEKLQRRSS